MNLTKLTVTALSLMAATTLLIGCADDCADVNCLNGGACNEGVCVCPDGFTGEFCQNTVDPCESVNCLNGGVCLNGNCDCPIGFSGEFCQTVEPCAGVVCLNGGICNNGNCDCAEGYTGTNCESEIRARFIGTFRGTRNHTSCPGPFFATITAGTADIMKIVITNLCDFYELEATVNPMGNSVIIASQSIFYPPHNTVYTFQGSGTISGDVITLTFNPTGALGNSTTPIVLVRQ